MRLDELRQGLRAWLSDAGRSSFSVIGGRVYDDPFPQGAVLPLVSLTRLPGTGDHTWGRRADPLFVHYQVSVWAKSLRSGGGGIQEAEQALSLIVDELDGHSGLTGGVSIQLSKLMTINPEVYVENAGLYQTSADFEVSFTP